jgi:hypothetical protein
MIIPYEVDVPFNHRPLTNYLIIAIAILVFVTQYRQMKNIIAGVALKLRKEDFCQKMRHLP